MSLIASRLSLTHRCSIERDANLATASWGDETSPDWQTHLSDLPCRTWATSGREQADEHATVVIEDMRILLPLGTDVTEQDRVGDVTYRGDTIIAGPVQIRAVLRYRDFLELALIRLH